MTKCLPSRSFSLASNLVWVLCKWQAYNFKEIKRKLKYGNSVASTDRTRFETLSAFLHTCLGKAEGRTRRPVCCSVSVCVTEKNCCHPDFQALVEEMSMIFINRRAWYFGLPSWHHQVVAKPTCQCRIQEVRVPIPRLGKILERCGTPLQVSLFPWESSQRS